MKLDRAALQSRIAYWRKVLGIEPRWRIHTNVVKHADQMPEDAHDATACISVTPYFEAMLFVNETEVQPEDLDAVVVHELLHIVFRPLELLAGDHQLAEWHGESVIEVVAGALVALERKSKKRR